MRFNLDNNQISETKRNRRTSSESDVTLSSSESSSGIDTPWEPQIKNHSIHCGNGEFVSSRSQGAKSDGMTCIYEEHHRSQWDWIGYLALEASTDDSSSTPRETSVSQHSESSSDVIENHKHPLKINLDLPKPTRFLLAYLNPPHFSSSQPRDSFCENRKGRGEKQGKSCCVKSLMLLSFPPS